MKLNRKSDAGIFHSVVSGKITLIQAFAKPLEHTIVLGDQARFANLYAQRRYDHPYH